MKRFVCLVGLVVLVFGLALVNPRGVEARDPTIKEIMSRLHKGAAAPIVVIKRDLVADPPNWAEAQRLSHEFVLLGAGLAKNEPPQGDKESWARLAKQYLDHAQAMEDASQRKDLSAALAAHSRLTGSCNGCHNAHRK
jgi:hypothetical protein